MAKDTTYRNPPGGNDGDGPASPREMARLEFGRHLWALILKAGMSQSDLARAADIGRDSVSGYIRGRNLPDPKHAKAMADALGIPLEKLYPGSIKRAMDNEPPAVELRQAAGHPGKAWLRINRAVSFTTGAKIIALLEHEDE
jgi:transcriptional regulator with XRE-family HTH domain